MLRSRAWQTAGSPQRDRQLIGGGEVPRVGRVPSWTCPCAHPATRRPGRPRASLGVRSQELRGLAAGWRRSEPRGKQNHNGSFMRSPVILQRVDRVDQAQGRRADPETFDPNLRRLSVGRRAVSRLVACLSNGVKLVRFRVASSVWEPCQAWRGTCRERFNGPEGWAAAADSYRRTEVGG